MKRQKKRVDVGASTLGRGLIKFPKSKFSVFFPKSQPTKYKVELSEPSLVEGQAPLKAYVDAVLSGGFKIKNIRVIECNCCRGISVVLPRGVYSVPEGIRKQVCDTVEATWFQFCEAGS